MSDPAKVILLVLGAVLVASAPAVLVAVLKAGWTDTLVSTLGPGGLALVVGCATIVFAGSVPPAEAGESPSAGSPVTLRAHLDEPLSRWLWLVKWLLAIPHAAILGFLWIAFAVLTVAAFVSILVTGRYPAALFATNVGILRWTWRVGFYAYSAIATDRYPPFSLRDADYPAHLDVAYPQHVSRGLAVVKWWLLAIPHYLIVAVFTGTSRVAGGLLPLLVPFAGVALLFTGRYPRGTFDLIVGVHRWIFRVLTYVCLMHDVYPPFRLDLGGDEPSGESER